MARLIGGDESTTPPEERRRLLEGAVAVADSRYAEKALEGLLNQEAEPRAADGPSRAYDPRYAAGDGEAFPHLEGLIKARIARVGLRRRQHSPRR